MFEKSLEFVEWKTAHALFLRKKLFVAANKTDKKVYTAGRLSRDSFREINRENHFKKEFPIGNSMYFKKIHR